MYVCCIREHTYIAKKISLTNSKLILPQEVRMWLQYIFVMLLQLKQVFSHNPISVIPHTAVRQSGAGIGIHP